MQILLKENKQIKDLKKIKNFQMAVAKTRPFTVLVEGNIGCGKTTFLKHFAKVCKTFFEIDQIVHKISVKIIQR